MTAEPASDSKKVAAVPAQRLCNEIQLFDLCDLEKCSFKVERFCTNAELLEDFERISDAEVVRPGVYVSEDSEECEDGFAEECDDAFEDDEFEDDAEYDEN